MAVPPSAQMGKTKLLVRQSFHLKWLLEPLLEMVVLFVTLDLYAMFNTVDHCIMLHTVEY